MNTQKTEIKKIIVVNTHGRGGGAIAMSMLCYLLAKRGYDSRLLIIPTVWVKGLSAFEVWKDWLRYHSHNWIKKQLNLIFQILGVKKQFEVWDFPYPVGRQCKFVWSPFFSRKNTLIVYPETIHGNFTGGKNIVRWLRLFYCYADDPTAYSENDMFICYRSVFNDWKLNPKGVETPLNYVNPIFKQYNYSSRKERCYLLRKGEKRKDLPELFDGPVIHWETSDEEVNKLFNEYKYCYFYDTQTMFATYAFVCGCIPIVILEPGKTRSDYLKGGDGIGYGIAYGNTPEEIKFAVETRDKALERLNAFDIQNEKSIDNFLSCLQERYILQKRKK